MFDVFIVSKVFVVCYCSKSFLSFHANLSMFFVVLIVFVKSCLQIQKTKNPGPMATPSGKISLPTYENTHKFCQPDSGRQCCSRGFTSACCLVKNACSPEFAFPSERGTASSLGGLSCEHNVRVKLQGSRLSIYQTFRFALQCCTLSSTVHYS